MRNMQKSVTFNTEEKKLIESAAKKAGLSYCAYLRYAALKEAEKILGRNDD